MYTENANRASGNGFITPENLEPNPKNPLIASFFRNIGRADRLGSGVHKLFKYTKFYSGKDPMFEEGDVFRIVVPLDDNYSFDMGIGSDKTGTNDTINGTIGTDSRRILELIKQNPEITQKQMQEETALSLRTVKRIVSELQKSGKLIRQGNNRSGKWQVQE